MTKKEKAVIVGLYRQGAKWEEISGIFKADIITLKIIISRYLGKINIHSL